jgi:hypothetical protein
MTRSRGASTRSSRTRRVTTAPRRTAAESETMMTTKTTDLTTTSAPTTALAVLDHDLHALRELLVPLGGALALSDLDRIKMPAGGALTFTVPTPGGEEPRRTLSGVLIHVQQRRAYWSQPFGGGGVAPDCVSADGFVGVGDPGGECLVCPHARFQDEEAPACRLTAECLFFQAGDLLPTILVASPASVRPVTKYLVSLAKRALKVSDVVTTFGLERVTSRGGIQFARLTCTMTGTLEPAQRTRMREIISMLGFGTHPSPATATSEVQENIPEHATLDLTTAEDVIPPPAPPTDDDISF